MAKRKKKNQKSSEPAAPYRLSELAPGVVSLAFLALAVRFFSTISDYAVNIFFSDQWDFNDATLFQKHSLWQMFTWQHGPHRQGAGALLAWLVEPAFRWNSRVESFVVGGVIAVAAVCALWLKKKLYGRLSYSDVIIPLIFFSTLQYETLFITANFAHGPLPLLFLVIYCVAWACNTERIRYPLVLAINFLTIYTGFGVLLGLITPIILALDIWLNLPNRTREGTLLRAGAMLIALLSFASFFIGYKNQPAAQCPLPLQFESPIDYAHYAALMFAPFLGALGDRPWPTLVGAMAVCAVAASLAWATLGLVRRRSEQRARLVAIVVLTAFCLLFCLATAYGRLCMGLMLAQSSRYMIYVGSGFLGIYLCLLNIPKPTVRRVLLVGLGVSLLGTISAGNELSRNMERFRLTKQRWKTCYLTHGDIDYCNRFARVYPWEPSKTRLQEKLDFLKTTRQNLFADSDER